MANARVTGSGVRLRRTPGGVIIGSLKLGETVVVLESDSGWARVNRGAAPDVGWVSAKHLKAEGAASPERGLETPAAFFQSLRTVGPFANGLTAAQTAGIEAVLAACQGLRLSWTAYVLATAAHETGRSFTSEKEENLNYKVEALVSLYSRDRISLADCHSCGRGPGQPADPERIANCIYGGAWGAANLGNTEPGDGWKYRGRGWAQVTGRANYARADQKLGLGGALLADPDRIFELSTCAAVTVRGMREGWFTGKKLDDYLKGRLAGLPEFMQARYIINKQDKAGAIAGLALAFQSALVAGGWR